METICNKYVGGWFTGLFMSVFFCFVFPSTVGLFQTVAHEAGKHCQHHLGFHLHHVVRQRVNTSSDLTGQWDGVPVRGQGGDELGGDDKPTIKPVESFVSYLALLSLSSSSFSGPFFTMSHLTVPGAMTSIRSIIGRLVLISLSCREHENKVKCCRNDVTKCIFTQIHNTCNMQYADQPWSC